MQKVKKYGQVLVFQHFSYKRVEKNKRKTDVFECTQFYPMLNRMIEKKTHTETCPDEKFEIQG